MLFVIVEHWEGVETGAVVMQLAFSLRDLGCVVEVPVAARVSIPAPMRESRHVCEDGVDGFGGRD